MNKKEFIYKKPQGFSLPLMKQQMEQQVRYLHQPLLTAKFRMRYGADGFEVLLEDNKIDDEKLQPEKLYLHLIGVNPYYGEVLEPWRVSFHHQQFGLGLSSSRLLLTLVRPFCQGICMDG